jgi:hypothetical protein
MARIGSEVVLRTVGTAPLLALCFARLGACDATSRFNETRTGPIQVVPQHKIQVGVTHRNGDC